MRPEWENLPFEKFIFEGPIHGNRKQEWFDAAEEILRHLERGENTGLIVPTSGGKTIIAYLVSLVMPGKMLFLAPTRSLCYQHEKLWKEVTGNHDDALSLTGKVKLRTWNMEGKKVVFATPHVLLADMGKKVFLTDFSFIVLDEFHHATGHYPYVQAARLAAAVRIPILALSASPGASAWRIEKVKENCYLKSIVAKKFATPAKTSSKIVVELGPALQELDALFRGMLKETGKHLLAKGLQLDPDAIPSGRKIEALKRQVDKDLPYDPSLWQVRSELVRYAMLKHSLNVLCVESYHSFLEYAKRSGPEESKAKNRLVADERYVRACELVSQAGPHPKAAKLLEVASSLHRMGKKAVVFAWTRENAEYLRGLLQAAGIKAAFVCGGGEIDVGAVLAQLAEGEVEIIVSTSVIQEGTSVPEVDAIIHYSMPTTEIERIQRDGRTGRMRAGSVIFIVLKHELDEIMYWSSLAKLKKMYRLLSPEPPPEKKKRKKRRKENPNQTKLSFME